MTDILFERDGYAFSYRVAGVCVLGGKVLLQKPKNDTGYAFPGGHSALGETNERTLVREFREETGADVTVGALMWVGELFFPWRDKLCQQICLYYRVDMPPDDAAARADRFASRERGADGESAIEFRWTPIDSLRGVELYPPDAAEWLAEPDAGVRHFVYREG